MVSIVKAGLNDIETIREITFATWPVAYGNIITQEQIDYMLDWMYSPEALHQQITGKHQYVLAQENNQSLAFASYYLDEGSIYKLNRIYILPNQQGKGLGRLMVDYIVNDILPKGATALRLQVNKQNTAKQFYEKIGFTQIGEAIFDIGKGFVMDDYIMELVIAKP